VVFAVFFRKAMMGLVVGTLVLCPYLCLAQAAAALVNGPTTDKNYRRPHCHCCGSHSASPTENGRPSGSGANGSGGTCLCHGAVLGVPQSTYDTPPSLTAQAWVDTTPAVFPPPSHRAERSFAKSAACHFPAADSGRKVRALIESLLL
jgi:hypothetical protein